MKHLIQRQLVGLQLKAQQGGDLAGVHVCTLRKGTLSRLHAYRDLDENTRNTAS
jgi:hypothetical protein